MTAVTSMLATARSFALGRQLRRIEQWLAELDMAQKQRLAEAMFREYGAAEQCPYPHLYRSSDDIRYQPWGDATKLACQRMNSVNLEVRLAGMALWIAVASHETKDSPHAMIQSIHRRLVRISRELRQSLAEPRKRPNPRKEARLMAQA